MKVKLTKYFVVLMTVMLSVLYASITQYHHHSELNADDICLCLVPAHHCHGHEHECGAEDADANKDSSCEGHNKHNDPSNCSIHIGQVVLQDQINVDCPAMSTLLACLLVTTELQHDVDDSNSFRMLQDSQPYPQPEKVTFGLRAPPSKYCF